ncbi:MAG: 16S rRNA (guanine(527)-N(7))-methyltransferase RsmG [Dehalococcoidia bacterium]|nr:16S rRNA (guanine(527)-N(7))-methyltransferase RsmG [Dehalococcoidia bacterium]
MKVHLSNYANEQSRKSLPPPLSPAGDEPDWKAIEAEFIETNLLFNLDVGPHHLERFRTFTTRLLEWNRRVNLTAITDPRSIFLRHFVDSLTALLALPRSVPGQFISCIDIGTGAGFPGVPLKIMRDDLDMTLLDSVGKKTAFLRELVPALDLERVAVVTGRSEDVARSPDHREQYQIVLSRAVAPLPALVEYLLPFCALGGVAIAMKKGDIDGELEAARHACRVLGGGEPSVIPVTAPGLDDGRVLVCIRKAGPTPDSYPRRAGTAAKSPL